MMASYRYIALSSRDSKEEVDLDKYRCQTTRDKQEDELKTPDPSSELANSPCLREPWLQTGGWSPYWQSQERRETSQRGGPPNNSRSRKPMSRQRSPEFSEHFSFLSGFSANEMS